MRSWLVTAGTSLTLGALREPRGGRSLSRWLEPHSVAAAAGSGSAESQRAAGRGTRRMGASLPRHGHPCTSCGSRSRLHVVGYKRLAARARLVAASPGDRVDPSWTGTMLCSVSRETKHVDRGPEICTSIGGSSGSNTQRQMLGSDRGGARVQGNHGFTCYMSTSPDSPTATSRPVGASWLSNCRPSLC